MPKQFKLVDHPQPQSDDNKTIEITESVEQKRTVNLASLKAQIDDIDRSIASLQTQKQRIKDEIAEAKAALNLK